MGNKVCPTVVISCTPACLSFKIAFLNYTHTHTRATIQAFIHIPYSVPTTTVGTVDIRKKKGESLSSWGQEGGRS